jgi:hypothetical protein
MTQIYIINVYETNCSTIVLYVNIKEEFKGFATNQYNTADSDEEGVMGLR